VTMSATAAMAVAGAMLAAMILATGPAAAQKQYDPGASDSEIKIGNIMPYSGPASAYGIIGKTEAAFFRMVNDQGGVNGRKIAFVSYDDAYSPPKAIEQARKLVESDQVLLIYGPLGTASNVAIRKYMNQKKVPQLFIASGATEWSDPQHFPWTMGWQPNYQSEARIYAAYILEHYPDGKIAVLYQNDDLGKDYVKGLKDGLGAKATAMIAAEASYETSDPTVDSQIVGLKASGATVFVNIATPKFAAQAIRKAAELGWHPVQVLSSVARSIGATLKPAGLENAKGILTAVYLKDPTDPVWQEHKRFRDWAGFMDKYFPDGDRSDSGTVTGHASAQTMLQVLQQCGDELTRANIMKHAANLRGLELSMLLPGITVNTGPADFSPLKQMQLARFTGDHWEPFGPIITGAVQN
jgi:branched-chain amino acid transport system substrate-binding protein